MTTAQTKTGCWDPTISDGSCIGAQPCCDKGFLLGIGGRKHPLMPCCGNKSDKFYFLLQEPWAIAVPLLQHPCCLSLSCMLLLLQSRSFLASQPLLYFLAPYPPPPLPLLTGLIQNPTSPLTGLWPFICIWLNPFVILNEHF